jgi:soluble lytic murein transglycosylase-like protein
MSVVRPMTIRDYLDPQRAAGGGSKTEKADGRRTSSFSEILKQHATMRTSGQTDGLRIADYMARPVLTRYSPKALPDLTERTDSEPTSPQANAGPRKSGTIRFLGQDAVERFPVRGSLPAVSRNAPGRYRAQGPSNDMVERSIQEAATRYRLSPALIRSVIRAESDFQPDAVSPAGAQGLMQLMPGTAEELGVTNPFDVRQNIDGGARYLRQMLDQFGGNLKLALAAYNAGPGAVTKYNGQVPYPETREYVKRVVRFYGERA